MQLYPLIRLKNMDIFQISDSYLQLAMLYYDIVSEFFFIFAVHPVHLLHTQTGIKNSLD